MKYFLNFLTLACAALLMLFSTSAHAYFGPGLGAGVVAVILGLLFAVLLLLIGVFWYPLKRFFSKKNTSDESSTEDN